MVKDPNASYWNGYPERDISGPNWQDIEWAARAIALSEKLRISAEMMTAGLEALEMVRAIELEGRKLSDENTLAMIYQRMAHSKTPLVGPRYADQVTE